MFLNYYVISRAKIKWKFNIEKWENYYIENFHRTKKWKQKFGAGASIHVVLKENGPLVCTSTASNIDRIKMPFSHWEKWAAIFSAKIAFSKKSAFCLFSCLFNDYDDDDDDLVIYFPSYQIINHSSLEREIKPILVGN